MSEWWTYDLHDFLLFSPRVYFRLLESHNYSLWPTHILAALSGLAIVVLLARPARTSNRVVPLALGAVWLFVAWAFLWNRYATINWPILYIAPLFVFEGLLLLLIGAVGGHLSFTIGRRPRDLIGLSVVVLAVVGYPLIAPITGRAWLATELFGIAPDPTAVATLGALALSRERIRWLLMIIPVLWCLITGATLWAMGMPDFFVAPLCAMVAAGAAVRPGR